MLFATARNVTAKSEILRQQTICRSGERKKRLQMGPTARSKMERHMLISQIMSLRIDVRIVGATTTISLAGELRASDVAEVLNAAAPHGVSLELDLKELSFVDSCGVEALRRMIDAGAVAVGASTFIEELLAI